MRIRPEQLAALEEAAEQQFAEEVIRHLRERFPRRLDGIATDDLRQDVRDAIGRARLHELTSRNDLRSFVVLAFITGRDFDRHPLVARFLDDPLRPPGLRMRALLRDMTPDDWALVVGDEAQ